MFALLARRTSPKYSLILAKSEAGYASGPESSSPQLFPSKSIIFLSALALLASIFLSAYTGYIFALSTFSPTQIHPFGPISIGDAQHITYAYNRTFPSTPSPASDRAWEELFPWQNGFFRHPTYATERSGLAVFHQLHCLNGIRKGYWLLLNEIQNTVPEYTDGDPDSAMVTSPGHVQHCIEYIRQALMCHADTNIEPVVKELHGVRGFGVEHTCRDYERVKAWTGEWAGYAQ